MTAAMTGAKIVRRAIVTAWTAAKKTHATAVAPTRTIPSITGMATAPIATASGAATPTVIAATRATAGNESRSPLHKRNQRTGSAPLSADCVYAARPKRSIQLRRVLLDRLDLLAHQLRIRR